MRFLHASFALLLVVPFVSCDLQNDDDYVWYEVEYSLTGTQFRVDYTLVTNYRNMSGTNVNLPWVSTGNKEGKGHFVHLSASMIPYWIDQFGPGTITAAVKYRKRGTSAWTLLGADTDTEMVTVSGTIPR